MKFSLVIVGATGELGLKLLKYCFKNNISVSTITSYKNYNLLKKLQKKYLIKNAFNLSFLDHKKEFINFLRIKKISLIYFLDYGSGSLEYANIFLNKNINSYIAIANKEMIILGGKILIKKIKSTKNSFIPLDSEHFSLLNSNTNNLDLVKIFITASGGPFYFNKSINLNNVSFKEVVSHPKWKMGVNNSIDSSNFVNKILEIHELSIIYDIDIKNIDFLISKEAFVHSLVLYNTGLNTLNCFNNDMIISLSYPLRKFFNLPKNNIENLKFLDHRNFDLKEFKDSRFKISKYIEYFKNLKHHQLIEFIILNNIAHIKYIKNDIKYNSIIEFLIKNMNKSSKNINFNNLTSILKYYNLKLDEYKKLI